MGGTGKMHVFIVTTLESSRIAMQPP